MTTKLKVNLHKLIKNFTFSLETQDDFFKSSTESPFGKVTGMTDFFERSADYALTSENVHRFIHSLEDIQFDLVINEEFFHDSFLMFAHKFNAPLITISKCLST